MDSFTFNETNTFVINVASSTDRLANVTRRLSEVNQPFTRWEASTPNTVTDHFVENWKNIYPGLDAPTDPLTRACAQSHINVWRHIVDAKLPYALIFEDDVRVDKNFLPKLQQFWKDINDPNFDVIHLFSAIKQTPFHVWNRVNMYTWCTVAYVISYKGASTLLKVFHNRFTVSDFMLIHHSLNGNAYTYYPWLAITDYSDSLIGHDSVSDTDFKVNHLKSDGVDLNNYTQ